VLIGEKVTTEEPNVPTPTPEKVPT
jgi:hypothetical protein